MCESLLCSQLCSNFCVKEKIGKATNVLVISNRPDVNQCRTLKCAQCFCFLSCAPVTKNEFGRQPLSATSVKLQSCFSLNVTT